MKTILLTLVVMVLSAITISNSGCSSIKKQTHEDDTSRMFHIIPHQDKKDLGSGD